MLLCINVSNSYITIGIFDEDSLILKTQLSSDNNKTSTEYAIDINNVLNLYNFDIHSITGAIISCVVPSLTSIIKSAVEFIYKGKIYIVGPKLKTGLKIKSENPAQIGSSLICQSVAINTKYQTPCLLISMETALSMFCIDKNGTFIGGAILPGLKISAKALKEHTAMLPQIDLSMPPENVIGTNTVQNVQSGLYFGTIASIDGMIERFKSEIGEDLCCVATGEIAESIFSNCKNKIIYDDNLVLEGLQIIYNKNHK